MHSNDLLVQQLIKSFAHAGLAVNLRQQAGWKEKEKILKKTESPGELVKSESYRYMRMIKRPAHNVKLIIKGPWANTGLQALLNTYEGEFLQSL